MDNAARHHAGRVRSIAGKTTSKHTLQRQVNTDFVSVDGAQLQAQATTVTFESRASIVSICQVTAPNVGQITLLAKA